MTSDLHTSPGAVLACGRVWRFVFLGGGLSFLLFVAAFAYRWSQATRELNAVHQALAAGNYDEAGRLLKVAEARQPDRGELHYLSAVVARRNGRLDDFQTRLQRAEQLGWSSQDLELQRCLAQAQTGDVQAVESQLRATIQRGAPDEVAEEIYEALATGYLASFRLREAWRILDYWLQWKPNAPQAHFLRAEIYQRREKVADAEADYRAVLTWLPEHYQAHLKLAQSLFKLQRMDEAIPHFQICKTARPEDVDVVLGLARCESRNGDATTARQRLQTVLQGDPTPLQRGAAMGELGHLLLREGQATQAVDMLAQAAALAPAEITIHYSLSRALAVAGQPERAQYHKARADFIRGQYERLSEITGRLVDQPQDAELRFEAGLILIDQGFTAEGLGWLRTALQCEPQHPKTLAYLAARRQFQAGVQAYLKHDSKGLRAAAAALTDVPGCQAHRALLQGMLLLQDGKLRDAIDQFGDAREHPETRVAAYTLSGEVLYKLYQYCDAEQVLRIALTLDPHQIDARRWLAAVYYDLGIRDDAMRQLQIVAEQAPDDPRPHRLLGLICKDFENYPAAVKNYRESLGRDARQGDHDQMVFELADCEIKLRQFEAALAVLSGCQQGADRWVREAECQYGLGRTAEATRLLDQALRQEPAPLSGWLLQGTIASEQGDSAGAIQAFSRAVAVQPKDYVTRFKLAQAYRRRGNQEEADKHAQAAEEIKRVREEFSKLHEKASAEPRNADVRCRLGVLARELGRPDLAVVWFRAALAIDPRHADTLRNLAGEPPPKKLPPGTLDRKAEKPHKDLPSR